MQLWGQKRRQNRLWKTVGSKIIAAVARNERRGVEEEEEGWGMGGARATEGKRKVQEANKSEIRVRRSGD